MDKMLQRILLNAKGLDQMAADTREAYPSEAWNRDVKHFSETFGVFPESSFARERDAQLYYLGVLSTLAATMQLVATLSREAEEREPEEINYEKQQIILLLVFLGQGRDLAAKTIFPKGPRTLLSVLGEVLGREGPSTPWPDEDWVPKLL